jgi:ABC-2 type transport system ATP-binding protein
VSGEQPILRVSQLHVHYRRGLLRPRTNVALAGVDLAIGRGSVFGLLGPNGAGKTTLVKVLLGLVRCQAGQAQLFGAPAGRAAPRRRVGYLPEAHRLPQHLTGRQVLEIFGLLCGRDRRWLRERIPGWLERLSMERDADRKVREYSKGMQQRIGLAQALVHEPELVFLDEPTDGVDPLGRAVVREVIAELQAKGTTVFINSHLLMEVEQMCDRVVILHKGRILREGSMEDLTRGTGAVRIALGREVADLPARLADCGQILASTPRSVDLLADEEQLGRAIDRLRADGTPIRSIEPQRLTLEQAFIDLVGQDTPAAGKTRGGGA